MPDELDFDEMYHAPASFYAQDDDEDPDYVDSDDPVNIPDMWEQF